MDVDRRGSRGTVLLAAESSARGFKTPRAFKGWCKRNDVTVTKVGRQEFVRSTDVDDAINRNAGRGRPSTNANVSVAIAALKRGK
ncbi:MAG: hypothetical protein EPO40_17740 [Myxococcaceae bacterium]|nr:MAG: hypothetical protein EPO40_17740 [Myxococcaceae bacterium]